MTVFPMGRLLPFVILSVTVSAPADAQVRASERASVTQTVDGTKITVDYARPRARGRRDLFGGEIKWNEVWTPGANMATTLEVSKDIELDGHHVPQGKYSVWMQVKEHGDWIVVLDTNPKLFHMAHPKPDSSQIRYSIKPERSDQTETLTWAFDEVRADGATLCMQWGRVRVPLRITVHPSHPIVLAADSARRYIGTYTMTDTDSVPQVTSYRVSYDKGSLWADWDPAPDPMMGHMLLIRISDGWFMPAIWQDGSLYDVMEEMVLEFKGDSVGATGFDLRGDGDELWATAVRK